MIIGPSGAMEFSDAPVSKEESGVHEEDSKNSEHGQEQRNVDQNQEILERVGKQGESAEFEPQSIESQIDCP